MSRLARKPIEIPKNVEVKIGDNLILVKGPKGELKRSFKDNIINIEERDGNIYLSAKNIKKNRESKMFLGTYSSHIKNMIKGVMEGFSKKLVIEGVGYKADARGKELVLNLGFSHPVIFLIPDNISVIAEKNAITVSGIDKEIVGLTASKIRALKKPEPYKGKGIRYFDEIIKRKAGKKSGS